MSSRRLCETALSENHPQQERASQTHANLRAHRTERRQDTFTFTVLPGPRPEAVSYSPPGFISIRSYLLSFPRICCQIIQIYLHCSEFLEGLTSPFSVDHSAPSPDDTLLTDAGAARAQSGFCSMEGIHRPGLICLEFVVFAFGLLKRVNVPAQIFSGVPCSGLYSGRPEARGLHVQQLGYRRNSNELSLLRNLLNDHLNFVPLSFKI